MRKFLFVAAATAVFVGSAAQATPLSKWLGNWERSSGEIVSVSIEESGGGLSVSAKGQCTPDPCDWGAAPGVAYTSSVGTTPDDDTQAIMAVFDAGFAKKTLLLDNQSGNSLRVHVYTAFTDGSGRSDYVQHGALKRARLTINPGVIAPALGLGAIAGKVKTFTEDCISFDPSLVAVANRNGSWKLIQGSMWMLDAGSNKSEMDTAKSIVQHYGLNKQCFVGRPDASLAYWLVDDAAPSGAYSGEDCVSINPNNLSVMDSGSHFTVVSNGNHYAFTAPSEAEANEIIEVIAYYGFTKSCYVGRPGPSMSYLRK